MPLFKSIAALALATLSFDAAWAVDRAVSEASLPTATVKSDWAGACSGFACFDMPFNDASMGVEGGVNCLRSVVGDTLTLNGEFLTNQPYMLIVQTSFEISSGSLPNQSSNVSSSFAFGGSVEKIVQSRVAAAHASDLVNMNLKEVGGSASVGTWLLSVLVGRSHCTNRMEAPL